jgi:hypothetical protein
MEAKCATFMFKPVHLQELLRAGSKVGVEKWELARALKIRSRI